MKNKPNELTKIKNREKILGNLDIKLNEINILFNDKLINGKDILIKEFLKQQKNLEKNYLQWNLNDLILYFKYIRNQFIIPDHVLAIFKELKIIENKKINEINESLLILCGWNNVPNRKYFLAQIFNILRDNNGFIGSNTNNVIKCCICTTLTANTVNVPCGHICYCLDCSNESIKHTNKCPFCRKNINDIIQIYKAGF